MGGGNSGLLPFGRVVGVLPIPRSPGCFADGSSMLMSTLPLCIPLAQATGIDLLRLAVLYLLTMATGLKTPPFGLPLFVMKRVAPKHITMALAYRVALPFLGKELPVLLLPIVSPPGI